MQLYTICQLVSRNTIKFESKYTSTFINLLEIWYNFLEKNTLICNKKKKITQQTIVRFASLTAPKYTLCAKKKSVPPPIAYNNIKCNYMNMMSGWLSYG